MDSSLEITIPEASALDIENGVPGKVIASDSFVAAAPAIRKMLRNVRDIYDYGAINNADCTTALNNAIADISSGRTLYIPEGNYYLSSAITVDESINLIGDHMCTSVFLFTHSGDGFTFTGLNGLGGGLRHMSLVYDIGANTGGNALKLSASAYPSGRSPDFFFAEGINITTAGSSLLNRGVYVDGSARQGVGVLVGCRHITMNNFAIFNCTTAGIELQQCRSGSFHRMAIYQGTGSTSGVTISGPSSYPSAGIYFTAYNGGNISLDRVSTFRGEGASNVTTTGNSSDVIWN